MKSFFKKLSDARGFTIRKWTFFGVICAGLLLSVWALFNKFFLFQYENEIGVLDTHGLLPINGIALMKDPILVADGVAILGLFLFIVCMLVLAVNAIITLFSLYAVFVGEEQKLIKCAKGVLITVSLLTGLYSVASFIAVLFINTSGGWVSTTNNVAPFIVALVLDVLFAVFAGLCRWGVEEKVVKKPRGFAGIRLELFLYGLVLTVVTLFALLTNIMTVSLSSGETSLEIIKISGAQLFRDRLNIQESGQVIVYCLFTMLVLLGTISFLSIISYFSKSSLFYKLTLANLLAGTFFCLLTGLFGKYYELVQGLNKELVASILEGLGYGTDLLDAYSYTVKSNSLYFFFGALVVLGVVLIRRPYTKGIAMETELAKAMALPDKIQTDVAITDVSKKASLGMGGSGGSSTDQSVPKQVYFADPCPAFTELDEKQPQFAEELEARRNALFDAPTLPKLVQFVVDYARDSRLHLSYTPEDIATFIAGLGTTRLSILQGMSGTGKTSLPKIFAEALMSRCEIVEVESSWRDKNELLGYYNEFSKIYTPKKFTQALYRAKLNPDVLTFIVLDEMNLSRIEYYFSDFLSLMENEPDKREIKLLNVALHRVEEGENIEYAGLTDGHTLKIPSNVWFIGTANRDESTFEISDKVYDRAHTMNFNKRAKKVLYHNEPIPMRYLPVDVLSRLFDEAQASVKFNIDNYPAIAQAEKLLAPYNISFGNRIAMQMESFVNVYCSCFSASEAIMHDAVEKILLSKVVSKLELKSVDNKDELALAFEELGFTQCSAFIKKLNED